MTATIMKEEGRFYWFFLEWVSAWAAHLVMKIPVIKTKKVDEDGEPYEFLQDWFWCEKYTLFFQWIHGKYKVSQFSADLQDVPKTWHDSELVDDDPPFEKPGLVIAYGRFSEARRLERSARLNRMAAANEVIGMVRSGRPLPEMPW
tara:strand:- start:16567 stop:17004 length:438 start_codon:yes stop_codon:yes gene_type:complete